MTVLNQCEALATELHNKFERDRYWSSYALLGFIITVTILALKGASMGLSVWVQVGLMTPYSYTLYRRLKIGPSVVGLTGLYMRALHNHASQFLEDTSPQDRALPKHLTNLGIRAHAATTVFVNSSIICLTYSVVLSIILTIGIVSNRHSWLAYTLGTLVSLTLLSIKALTRYDKPKDD